MANRDITARLRAPRAIAAAFWASWPLLLGILLIGIGGADPGAARAQPAAHPVSHGEGEGAAATEPKIIKMDPLVANLDEGDQLRYVKVSLSLEIAGDAQAKIQISLARARHESIMYLSGLHLTDVQGQLGRQRIYRELQRRIADAVGTPLRRVYFDEFVVQ